MSAPILACPHFQGEPFILDTDLSADPGAIGGVLSQVQDGQERVITYGARRLLPLERSYASTKGELLAVISFLQYYKYYLLYRLFILHTDNRALTWIRSLESPTGMILRWLEILASFDFTVKHRKGTLHGNADSLSRAPHAALPSSEEEKILVSDEAAVVAALQTPPGFTTEEIRDHQEKDEHLRDIQKWKTEPPSEMEKQLLSPDQRRLLAFLPSLHRDPSFGFWSLQTQEEGVSSECPYIPCALRHRIIEAAHQFLGHAGITATAHFCRKRVYDGEEVGEENNFNEQEEFERSNDNHRSSFINETIDEGGSAYDLFNRYAEHVLRERVETLMRENAQLRAEYQRLSNR